MSSTNFIVVKELKLVAEVHRDINEYNINSDKIESVMKLIEVMDNSDEELEAVIDRKYTEIKLKDLTLLVDIASKAEVMVEFKYAYFLILWLDANKIEYEIVSEFNINLKEFEELGYIIKRICYD